MSSGDTTATASTTVVGDASPSATADVAPVLPSRFELRGELGSGGMAVVFEAHDRELDRLVAIKVLRLEGARHAPRVRREAQAMARIDHPNVVRVHDVIEHGASVMVVMERLPGGALSSWLRTRRPWREVRDLFCAAGRGLAAAHAAGIVHRDFKPSNVLLAADGQPKVGDFGIAALSPDEVADVTEPSLEVPVRGEPLTRTGTVLGTPAYMAPEQLAGERVDERCDQFAFCVALFEGLYGVRPFRWPVPGEPLSAYALALAAGPIATPAAPELPAAFEAIVLRGLATLPSDRWPSMAALCDALAGVDAPAAVPRPRHRRRAWIAGVLLAGVAVAAVAVAAGLGLVGGSRPRATAPAPAAAGTDDPLNLTFESVDGALPRSWRTGIGGGATAQPVDGVTAVELSNDARTGARGLHLRSREKDRLVAAVSRRSADGLHGKRVVLHGWIRTDAVAEPGWAGLWLRVDGTTEPDPPALGPFDNMSDRGLVGAAAWRQASVFVDVPADATGLSFGAILGGVGSAWYDDLAFEVFDPAARPTITLAGTVVDDAGAPLPGATVASWRDGTIGAVAVSDGAGAFRLDVPAGMWGLSAVHASGVARAQPPQRTAIDRARERVTVGGGAGVAVRGRVVPAPPSGAWLAVRAARGDGEVFAVPVAADGSFAAKVPPADGYELTLDRDGLRAAGSVTATSGVAEITLHASRPSPAPPEVLAWARTAARPLTLDVARTPVIPDGLVDAPVIGLAMPVRSTRELARLATRAVEQLAARRRPVIVVLETDEAAVAELDRLVQGDGGDARAAVERLHWRWRTREHLALVQMIAAWNARHPRAIRLVGLVSSPAAALDDLRRFLREVDPAADVALAPFATLAEATFPTDLERTAARDALDRMQLRFERDAAGWRAQAGAPALLRGRDAFARLGRWVRTTDGTLGGDRRGDTARMLELATANPHASVLLLANDDYVGTRAGTVGGVLRAALGDRYVAIGVLASGGRVRAIGTGRVVLRPGTIAPGDVPAVCAPLTASAPRTITDLRGAPAGEVAAWLGRAFGIPVQAPDGVGDARPVITSLAATYDAIACVGELQLDDDLMQ